MNNIPIKNGVYLLKQSPFSDALDKLKPLISAVETDFDKHYVTTVQRFAELTQTIPYQQEKDTLLFSYQMETALAALQLTRGRLMPQKAVVEDKNHRAPAWMYGLFTVALLRGIERLQQDRVIALLDRHGKVATYWSPVGSPTFLHYADYQLLWRNTLAKDDKRLSYPVPIHAAACRSLLVSHVIPNESLAWLQADNELNTQWWDCLCEHAATDNELAQLLQEAAKQLGRVEHGKDKPANSEEIPATTQPLKKAQPPEKKTATTAMETAEPAPLTQQFIDWLTEQLSVEATKSFIFRVELGVFVMNEALEQFMKLKKVTYDELINVLLAENKIVKHNQQVTQRYATKDLINPDFFEGIVLNLNGLTTALVDLSLQNDRQPDVM